jgi:hypothetical protein
MLPQEVVVRQILEGEVVERYIMCDIGRENAREDEKDPFYSLVRRGTIPVRLAFA